MIDAAVGALKTTGLWCTHAEMHESLRAETLVCVDTLASMAARYAHCLYVDDCWLSLSHIYTVGSRRASCPLWWLQF